MAQNDSDTRRAAVPYVPFSTFCTGLDHLKNHGTPDKIDASVFPNISGGMVSHLLLTMRLLNLIGEDGKPQPALPQLIDDKTRKQTLARILPQAYASLLQRVDLAKASPAQLDEALRQEHVRGATHKKARAFLIKAATFAELPVSNHLRKRTRNMGPRKNGTSKKTKKTAAQIPKLPTPSPQTELKYSKLLKLPQAGGTLTLSGDFDPFSLRGKERDLVYKLTDLMSDFESNKETASE